MRGESKMSTHSSALGSDDCSAAKNADHHPFALAADVARPMLRRAGDRSGARSRRRQNSWRIAVSLCGARADCRMAGRESDARGGH